jgi:hypothetical protein
MEGEPLDVPRLLWTPEGKPRLAVLSIAHLSDAERMFFVTLLLNEVIAWMRTQPGTSSLRALLYMDEVFGYFPPTANPPSKTPMLTLLKQARAFGVGVVLATQNPVDLDYKGLSNAGTWFLGRLQTERDKARVLDGLEGASASQGSGFDRKRIETILSGLGSRVFLMNNVHDNAPVLFQTRWALCYLRGPLTRSQIQTLTASRRTAAPVDSSPPAAPVVSLPAVPAASPVATVAAMPAAPSVAPAAASAGAARPVVPPGVVERFWHTSAGSPAYQPALLGTAQLHFVDAKTDVDHWEPARRLVLLGEDAGADPWQSATTISDAPELDTEPVPGATFAPLPPAAARPKSYAAWEKQLASRLYRDVRLTLHTIPALKLTSQPGESEADFRIRAGQAAREQRDQAVEKLRAAYGQKLQRLQERIRTAEAGVERERSQYQQQWLQTGISIAATVLGAISRRKMASIGNVGRATTAARGVGRATQKKQAVGRATESVETLRQQVAQLEAEFEAETRKLGELHHPDRLEVQPIQLPPRKSDLTVAPVQLIWVPQGVLPTGPGL